MLLAALRRVATAHEQSLAAMRDARVNVEGQQAAEAEIEAEINAEGGGVKLKAAGEVGQRMAQRQAVREDAARVGQVDAAVLGSVAADAEMVDADIEKVEGGAVAAQQRAMAGDCAAAKVGSSATAEAAAFASAEAALTAIERAGVGEQCEMCRQPCFLFEVRCACAGAAAGGGGGGGVRVLCGLHTAAVVEC
eukprot:851403-Pleurochrysis_carterae.AAC.1